MCEARQKQDGSIPISSISHAVPLAQASAPIDRPLKPKSFLLNSLVEFCRYSSALSLLSELGHRLGAEREPMPFDLAAQPMLASPTGTGQRRRQSLFVV
jgi:hypothetical protein